MKLPQTKILKSLAHRIAPSARKVKLPISQSERLGLARLACPWFDPPGAVAPKGWTKAKWESLSKDEKSIIWLLIFPARCAPDYQEIDPPAVVDFFATITRENAIAWLYHCPPHLRSAIDEAAAKAQQAHLAPSGDATALEVCLTWGERPFLPCASDEGLTLEDELQLEVWREWCHLYDQITLAELVVRMAPSIQDGRRKLQAALGGKPKAGALPDQSDGLDDAHAATVAWLQSTGETPLEFLARMYRDENAKPTDRIAAARSMMDYVHKKVPTKQEIDQKVRVPTIDPSLLGKLSKSELANLSAMFDKMENDDGK